MSPGHVQEIKIAISKIILSMVTSADEATASYERICKEFLNRVIRAKGTPARMISNDLGDEPDVISSSGKHIARKFDALLPALKARFEWCVMNYKSEAQDYLGTQLGQLDAMLQQFLEQVPVGGTKENAIRRRITGIKREILPLAKWDQRFYTHKAMSFPSEVEFIFCLEGNPVAAIWHYNPLDEQGIDPKIQNHKQRDSLVFAVRDNWAIIKGLMRVGPNGYLDEVSRPSQEAGCMCRLQWVYSINRLPANMVTEKGHSELKRVQVATRAGVETQKPKSVTGPETEQGRLRSWLRRWTGRGNHRTK
jgi:hypothetical protein